MKINKAKIKILFCSRNKGNQMEIIRVVRLLDQVNEYKNTGSKITEDGLSTKVKTMSKLNHVKCTLQNTWDRTYNERESFFEVKEK